MVCYIEIEFQRSNGMRLTTLVELHRSNELRSNLVEHVGSKFVKPFFESKQQCASTHSFVQANSTHLLLAFVYLLLVLRFTKMATSSNYRKIEGAWKSSKVYVDTTDNHIHTKDKIKNMITCLRCTERRNGFNGTASIFDGV